MLVETLKEFMTHTNFSYRTLLTYKKKGLIVFQNEKIDVEKSLENINKYLLLSKTALGTKISIDSKKLQVKKEEKNNKLLVNKNKKEKTNDEEKIENPADVLVSNQSVFIKNKNEEKNKIVINNTKKNFENFKSFEDKNNEEIEDEIDEDEFFKKYENGELKTSDLIKLDDYLLKKLELLEKTRKQKIDNDEKEGVLISRQAVEFQIETLGKFLKDRIFELPNRLSVELAAITDANETKIFLKEELTKIFKDFLTDLEKILE